MSSRNPVEEMPSRSSSLTLFEERLLNLIALHLTEGRSQAEQISLLSRAGYKPTEIAALLGTTPNTVSVYLSKAKREGRQQKK